MLERCNTETVKLHNPDLVQVLDKLLAQAKEGEIRSVIVIVDYPNGKVNSNWSCSYNTKRMFGEMDYVKHSIMMQQYNE